MRKLHLFLFLSLVLGMLLAISCGGAAPAPTATVTKTSPPVTVTVTSTPGAAPATVTQTLPPVTVTATPTPAKLVKATVSEPTGGTGSFFSRIGREKGLFEKRGIELEVKELATSAARVAPFVGQADFSPGDTIPLSTERKDIKIVGPYFGFHQGLVVRKDSPYRSYQDLKGKKIGILGPATGQYQGVKIFTKLEGMDLEKDFILTIGEATVQIGWLLKGEVEAIHLFEPHISKLLISDPDKVRELYWLNDLYKKHTGSSYLYGGIYTSEDWVKKNTELARQIGLAYDDILNYAYRYNQVWKSDLAQKVWGVTDPPVLELLTQRLPRIVENPPYGPAYKGALVKKAQLLADAGLLPQGITVDWYKGTILFAD